MLAATSHVFVSQTTSELPGLGNTPGLAASQRPSGLNTSVSASSLVSVVTILPFAGSRTVTPGAADTSHRPLGLMATVCGPGCPANSRDSRPVATSQIFTEFTGYSAAATCFPSGLNATAVNPLELTRSSSPCTLVIAPPVATDHTPSPRVEPRLVTAISLASGLKETYSES